MRAALKREDGARMVEIFGRQSAKIFITGDPIDDAIALRTLSQKFDQRAELFPVISEEYKNEQWYLIRYATEGWNMHVPLVNRGKGWSFATEYATQADLRARKSLNEVAVVDTLLALVKAQEEYRSRDHDGDGVYEYAQHFISTRGTRDGLYWSVREGEPSSPLGGIVARAIQDGYRLAGKNTPYGGYLYRILTKQGGKTRGGARTFLVDGKLTDNFVIFAYPIEWGASGDASFLVAKDGQVWKRDFGPRTDRIAPDIDSMNLDYQWVRAVPHLGGKNSRSNW
jgi:hypothetical protein